jgi:hypothetical protein
MVCLDHKALTPEGPLVLPQAAQVSSTIVQAGLGAFQVLGSWAVPVSGKAFAAGQPLGCRVKHLGHTSKAATGKATCEQAVDPYLY